jgi:DNA-directed RNA polymerase specialized sigma24 family protein
MCGRVDFLDFKQREEYAMAQTVKSVSNAKTDWEEALALYREELSFYLEYLIRCRCDHQILAKAEAEARERHVPDEFKLRFLTRTLVRNVIQHMRECSSKEPSQGPAPDDRDSVTTIPAQERLVYFMRDILEYSTRDTALLIGIADAQVEKLLSLARKRIDLSEGPSSLEIETPEWTYFRWKFADLDLS